MPFQQPDVRRQHLCVAGGRAEPAVPAALLSAAVSPDLVEQFRPLLPVGYAAGADAYRAAVAGLSASNLTNHYTDGLSFFHERLIPHVKDVLRRLSGGVFQLDDFVAYAAGSDCDFITHVVEAVAARERVRIFSGDWYGFRAGCTQLDRIAFSQSADGAALVCLCIPSVRNGHLTDEMLAFLEGADTRLLNLNLYPTLPSHERRSVAERLAPLLPGSVLSISFSRGFGLTASQLGVALVHRDHPFVSRFSTPWAWHTYFFNAIAARAFMLTDLARLASVDEARRRWVASWLTKRSLPALETGSYYVRSFRCDGAVPDYMAPLAREGVVRLCFKPPLT